MRQRHSGDTGIRLNAYGVHRDCFCSRIYPFAALLARRIYVCRAVKHRAVILVEQLPILHMNKGGPRLSMIIEFFQHRRMSLVLEMRAETMPLEPSQV